ncbi:MAG: glycerophosphodiester phosphodiesterase [Bdellovibrio sp.]
MGHRGAKDEYPENTLKGINFALEQGCPAVEIDIHLSKDGELVVIHDDTIDRTTNGKGKVLDYTLAELKRFDAGQGETIPTLKEVLQTIQSHHSELVIEIKAAHTEEKLIKLLEEMKMIDKVSVISFNHRIVKKVKELKPQIKTAVLIYGLPEDAPSMIKAAKADGASVCVATIDKKLVEDCHAQGFYVAAWNINVPEQLPYFIDMGIDFLGTDRPSVIVPALKNYLK